MTDANGQYSDVVFGNPNGDVLWWLEQPATQDAQYAEIHDISQLLKTVPPESHLTAWAVTGASLLGFGGMLLATSGNSDSKNPNKHNHSDHLPDFNSIGSNDSESVNDSHSPNPPELLALSNDGLTMSGTGEAGCRVTVKDALGRTVATGTVGSDGNFSFTLPEAQKNGETLYITLTDGAGNTSAAITVTAPDTTAPSAPADLVLSDNGQILSGTGEAGARLTVKDAGGRMVATGTVGSDGNFSITLPEAQTNEETLQITLTDSAGNTSAAITIMAPDATAPSAPVDLVLSGNGQTLNGTGEAGAKVTVKDALGSTFATGTVGSDGNFSITLPEAQKNGETLHITLTDGAGNTSAANTVTALDTTAPSAPADLVLSDDGLTLSGTGEAGAKVTVKDAEGHTLATSTVGSSGTFTVMLSEPQTSGDTLSVILTDTAGNISSPSTIQYVDETLVAHDDRHSMAVTAVQDNLNGNSGEISQLAGISLLGDNVVLSLLSSNSFKFMVDENTLENVTLDVSGGVTLSTAALLSTTLSILGVSSFIADLSVIDTSTGKVVQTISDAVKINGAGLSLVYNGSAYVTDLAAGTYTVAVSTASSDSLLQTLINWLSKFGAATSLNIEISDFVQYTFGSAEGNVLTNDASGDVADTGKKYSCHQHCFG